MFWGRQDSWDIVVSFDWDPENLDLELGWEAHSAVYVNSAIIIYTSEDNEMVKMSVMVM